MTDWRWGDGWDWSTSQREEIEACADAAMDLIEPVYAEESGVWVFPDSVLSGWASLGVVSAEQVDGAAPALLREDGRSVYLVALAPEAQRLLDERRDAA